MQLPVTDVVRSLPAETFFCPGSLVRVARPVHPLAFGMPEETAALLADGSAYDLRHGAPPSAGVVAVPARYGAGNPLLSGWLDGPEHLAGKAAVVEVSVGQGRVVLVGVPPAAPRPDARDVPRALQRAVHVARLPSARTLSL